MDYLRSCYKSRLQYIQGNPGATTLATWYFCRPGAAVFPGPHAFGSPTWDSQHPTITTLGWDATKPRNYYNGRRLNSSAGLVPAGPLEFFRSGAIADGILTRGVNSTPVECLSPPFGGAKGGLGVPSRASRGGKKFLGYGSQSIAPGMPCGECPVSITPATVIVHVSGFTGVAAGVNGTWPVPQVLPCVWQMFPPGGYVITIQRVPGHFWVGNIAGPFPTSWNANGTHLDDCTVATSLPGIGGPGAPVVSISF